MTASDNEPLSTLMPEIFIAETETEIFRLDISGSKFTILKSLISRADRPGLLLDFVNSKSHSDRAEIADAYLKETSEYFFQRSPDIFSSVLAYHLHGCLHIPPNIVCQKFCREELDFWQVNSTENSGCCHENSVSKPNEHLTESPSKLTNDSSVNNSPVSCKIFVNDETDADGQISENFSLIQGRISENSPTHAKNALIIRGKSGTPVIGALPNGTKSPLYLSGSSVGSLHEKLSENSKNLSEKEPDSQNFDKMFEKALCGNCRKKLWQFFEDPNSSKPAKYFGFISISFVIVSVLGLVIGSMEFAQEEDGEPHQVLVVIETVCIIWFTIEYLIRFFVTSEKLVFLRGALNIIDVLALVPFYLELVLALMDSMVDKLGSFKGLLMMVRVLRVLRVARVFKLARHSGNLQSFGETLRTSKKEFVMLAMYLGTSILLFSSCVYFFEKDAEKTSFTSIPASFWWCIVTMTTVGYGDMIPVTVGGKLFASFTTISGVIVLAFPVTMIVSNFGKAHNKEGSPQPEGGLYVRSVAIV